MQAVLEMEVVSEDGLLLPWEFRITMICFSCRFVFGFGVSAVDLLLPHPSERCLSLTMILLE